MRFVLFNFHYFGEIIAQFFPSMPGSINLVRGENEDVKDSKNVRESSPTSTRSNPLSQPTVAVEEKKTFVQRVLEPGSVWSVFVNDLHSRHTLT